MNSTDAFTLTLNGRDIEAQGHGLTALLQAQGYSLQAAFACAVNHRFVPRESWAQTLLQRGDRVEVIAPVTGG